jgi:hypothetical protein
VKKNNGSAEGPDSLVYTACLPLSSATLNYLAGLIRGHLKKIGSRWRALPPGKIAGLVLAVLRCDQRPGDLAGGNGVHRTTVTRWVREVVGLLAARAPRLDREHPEPHAHQTRDLQLHDAQCSVKVVERAVPGQVEQLRPLDGDRGDDVVQTRCAACWGKRRQEQIVLRARTCVSCYRIAQAAPGGAGRAVRAVLAVAADPGAVRSGAAGGW